MKKDCWAPGGGAEGKGPKKGKGKEKEKETAAKAEEKEDRNHDSDAVWMAVVKENELDDYGSSGDDLQLWTDEEIAEEERDEEILISSDSESSLSEFFSDTEDSVDLVLIFEGVDDNSSETFEEDIWKGGNGDGSNGGLLIDEDPFEEDQDDGAKTRTLNTTMLESSKVSSGLEAEYFDSGTSQHISPYRPKFTNFMSIPKKVLTAKDGSTFEVVGKGDLYISQPNDKTITKILLEDVLYLPNIGETLVSTSKIDVARNNCYQVEQRNVATRMMKAMVTMEQWNKTLLENLQPILHASQFPKILWGKAVERTVYLENRTSTEALNERSPYETFYGVKPSFQEMNSSLIDGSEVGGWVKFDEESVYLSHNVPLEGEEWLKPEQSIVLYSGPKAAIRCIFYCEAFKTLNWLGVGSHPEVLALKGTYLHSLHRLRGFPSGPLIEG
jgi:hypothetical protein